MIVTPNIHHISMLQDDCDLRSAYENASLWPADGWPVALMASILSRSAITRIPGSDLVELVAAWSAVDGFSVAIVGGSSDAAELAAAKLMRAHPDARVVWTDPLPNLDVNDEARLGRLVDKLESVGVDVLLLGLGAPKQELVAASIVQRLSRTTIFCIGAGINFAAASDKRAPRYIQLIGLEWLHRLVADPRRLGPRYVRSGWSFLSIVARQSRHRRS